MQDGQQLFKDLAGLFPRAVFALLRHLDHFCNGRRETLGLNGDPGIFCGLSFTEDVLDIFGLGLIRDFRLEYLVELLGLLVVWLPLLHLRRASSSSL